MRNFLLIHFIICVLYILIFYRKIDLGLVYRVLIIFFMPIAGVLLFIILETTTKKNNVKQTKVFFETYEELNPINLSMIRKLNLKSEMNIVPIEDALIINSDSVKRKMIFDILKEDSLLYMSHFEKALTCTDSETSHYAATAVVDLQKKIIIALQEFSVKYENNKKDLDVLMPYSEALKKYLSSKLLDDKNRRKYQYIYSDVLENILLITPEKDTFIEKINCDFDLNEFISAKNYCDIFLKQFHNIEEPYIMLMKYYYLRNDIDSLKNLLNEHKKSKVKFSNKFVELVRYWRGIA